MNDYEGQKKCTNLVSMKLRPMDDDTGSKKKGGVEVKLDETYSGI